MLILLATISSKYIRIQFLIFIIFYEKMVFSGGIVSIFALNPAAYTNCYKNEFGMGHAYLCIK